MLFQWFVFYLLVIVLAGWRVFKYTSALPAIALTYFLVSGAFVYAYKYNHFATSVQYLIPTASLASLDVSVAIIMTVFFLLCIPKRITNSHVASVISLVTIYNSLLVCFNLITRNRYGGNHGYHGLIDSSGINSALIASGITSVFSFGPVVTVICLIAVAAGLSSIPYGVLLATVSAYLLKNRDYKKLLGLPVIMLVGFVVEKGSLFNDSGRFDIYRLFMTEWWKKGLLTFGTGMGTFQFVAPIIQCEKQFLMNANCEGFFIRQMHSDWLELVFQFGIVGTIVVVLLCACTTKRLWNARTEGSSEIFALFIGTMASAVFSYPMHYQPTFFVALMCVWIAYRRYPLF